MNKSTRFWEIDTWRGITIVVMIYFHFMWDISYFKLYPIDILTPFWQTFARSIATSFTLILGISLTLSYQRAKERFSPSELTRKYLLRGGQIFGLGLLITVGTRLFFGSNGFVIFGILHMLGTAVVVGYVFLGRNKWLTLLVGLVIIAIGIYFNGLTLNSLDITIVAKFSHDPWWIPLGIKQYSRSMVDYYPIFPWTGVALLGIFVGQTLYPAGQPRVPLPDWGNVPLVRGLRFLGQHSLLIYLVHQPLLIGLLMAFQSV